jgi:hypothetical protein
MLLMAEYVDDEPGFTFQFLPSQVIDLASGYVPADVRAMCLAALDWREEDRRRAARPVPKKKSI